MVELIPNRKALQWPTVVENVENADVLTNEMDPSFCEGSYQLIHYIRFENSPNEFQWDETTSRMRHTLCWKWYDGSAPSMASRNLSFNTNSIAGRLSRTHGPWIYIRTISHFGKVKCSNAKVYDSYQLFKNPVKVGPKIYFCIMQAINKQIQAVRRTDKCLSVQTDKQTHTQQPFIRYSRWWNIFLQQIMN